MKISKDPPNMVYMDKYGRNSDNKLITHQDGLVNPLRQVSCSLWPVTWECATWGHEGRAIPGLWVGPGVGHEPAPLLCLPLTSALPVSSPSCTLLSLASS